MVRRGAEVERASEETELCSTTFLTKSIVSCNLVFSRVAEKSETASCISDPCSFGGCSGSALKMLHSRRHERWAAAKVFRGRHGYLWRSSINKIKIRLQEECARNAKLGGFFEDLIKIINIGQLAVGENIKNPAILHAPVNEEGRYQRGFNQIIGKVSGKASCHIWRIRPCLFPCRPLALASPPNSSTRPSPNFPNS